MIQYPLIAAGVLLAVLAVRQLVLWRRAAAKRSRDREQIDRKLKEDALDQALSNQRSANGAVAASRAEPPVEIHYKDSAGSGSGAMVRLTEQGEAMAKEYLFRISETIYLGEEFERAAVFREKASHKIFCELYPYHGEFFARSCGSAPCRLLRRQNSAVLTSKPVRLHSKDRIETQGGVFLVEFIMMR